MTTRKREGRTSARQHRLAGDVAAGAMTPSPPLVLEVVWGDIQRVPDGDVYAAGHYIDVPPLYAEEALDEIISDESLRWAPGDELNGGERLQVKRTQRVVHSLTIRGGIRGAVGDVNFFPMAEWHARTLDAALGEEAPHPSRMIAIVGMGHMGSFGAYELRRLGQSVAVNIARLPKRRRVCSVLIGSGVGNLSIEQAVEGMTTGFLQGVEDARLQEPMTLCLVERGLGRAHRIYRELAELVRREPRLQLVGTGPIEGRGGDIAQVDALALALGSIASIARTTHESGDAGLLQAVLAPGIEALGGSSDRIDRLRQRLVDAMGDGENVVLGALTRLEIGIRQEEGMHTIASSRLTCLRELDEKGRGILSFAALSSSAVVPKRYNPVNWDVVLDVVRSVEALAERAAPSQEQMDEFPPTLSRLLVPREFRPYLAARDGRVQGDAPVVFELDRQTAMVHWEMLDIADESDGVVRPVAVSRPVARQLRTEYTSAPSSLGAAREQLRILLVVAPGEPGDAQQYLHGVLREAEALRKDLVALGAPVVVDVLVGSPHDDRSKGLMAEHPPATRLAVLQRLLSPVHRYDILHYSGHAWFDEKDQAKSGWYLSDGVLTAGELDCLDVVPQLVVANACLSARAAPGVGRGRDRVALRDYALTPALADEFFKRGVRAYVGTAWAIEDGAARQFAESFYRTLLMRDDGAAPPSAPRRGLSSAMGEAMLAARVALWKERESHGLAWAAYQHYGDPMMRLTLPGGRGPRD